MVGSEKEYQDKLERDQFIYSKASELKKILPDVSYAELFKTAAFIETEKKYAFPSIQLTKNESF